LKQQLAGSKVIRPSSLTNDEEYRLIARKCPTRMRERMARGKISRALTKIEDRDGQKPQRQSKIEDAVQAKSIRSAKLEGA